MSNARPADRSDNEFDLTRLRRALGGFVSGVTVVTTAHEYGSRDVHGMTANAFISVSMRPPLVLISVSNTAHLHQRLVETGRYGVSVLAAYQEPLAQHFAGRQSHPELVRFLWRDGLPLVHSALVQLTCTVVATYPAGDHSLHIGRVDTVTESAGDPLVFHNRVLRGLGSAS